MTGQERIPALEDVPELTNLSSRNPWQDLPTAGPYVLPVDKPIIDAYHSHEAPQWHYRLDLPPDPWQGRWDSPLVVLLQNPSLGEHDDTIYSDPAVLAANRRNMTTNAGSEPMYWLEDDLSHTYSGKWWRSRLRSLIGSASLPTVRNRLLVVELYGYRSQSFRPLPITLPSQVFSLDLVRAAMDRGATIVLPRAAKYWEIALPSLHGYPHLVHGRSRSAHLTPGNLEPGGYERVTAAITKMPDP